MHLLYMRMDSVTEPIHFAIPFEVEGQPEVGFEESRECNGQDR